MYEIYVLHIHFSVVKARVTGVQSFWTHDLVDIVEKRDFKKKVHVLQQSINTTYLSRNCTFWTAVTGEV